jgi:N-acetylneuraminic acid mutarotase
MFLPTDSMSSARNSHTATLLQNGKVLIAGGYGHNGEYLSSAELYDPLTGKFLPTGQLKIPRAGHIAVLLNNGKVLLAGGVGTGWTFLNSAELYDPNKNTFALTGNMTVARESHTATLLKDGKVLISGGHKGRQSSIIIYSSAELYDPTSGLFTSTTNMLTKRHKHDAVLLEDGRVLVVGGADERDDGGQYSSAEIYDPHAGIFTMLGNMNASRYKFQGTSVLLRTSKVLLIGGASITEIYDPVTNTFSKVVDGLGTTRLFATATSLPDGKVILVGGYGTNISASANAWIFQP